MREPTIRIAYFTICARNYLAYAQTLGQSLKQAEPDADFFIFICDGLVDAGTVSETVIQLDDLALPGLDSMAFRYYVLELATAIKPSCFKYLLANRGYGAAVYLDPDIQVFAPLSAVHEAFRAGASAVLTPHLLAPLEDSARPTNLEILRSGTFNLGFAAFTAAPEAMRFLDWWEKILSEQGYDDIERGLFVDQKFAEFIPSFISSLKILRDPGYNVAYWNLVHRPVKRAPDGWTAGGAPLVFFHFSGVVPGNPEVFSKHQDRFSIDTIGDAAELVRAYLEQLDAHGQSEWSGVPYAYAKFRDGTPVPGVVRHHPPTDQPPETWLDTYDAAWWDAPSERVDTEDGIRITRLMLAIHASRPDLREAFPLSSRSGRQGFHAWFLAHGAKEYRLSEAQAAAALTNSALRSPSLARQFARLKLFVTGPGRR